MKRYICKFHRCLILKGLEFELLDRQPLTACMSCLSNMEQASFQGRALIGLSHHAKSGQNLISKPFFSTRKNVSRMMMLH